jgi:hypothetical protein
MPKLLVMGTCRAMSPDPSISLERAGAVDPTMDLTCGMTCSTLLGGIKTLLGLGGHATPASCLDKSRIAV